MGEAKDDPASTRDQTSYSVALRLPPATGWMLMPGPSDPTVLARALRRQGPCLDLIGGSGVLLRMVRREHGTEMQVISDHRGRMQDVAGPDRMPALMPDENAAQWAEAADGYALGIRAAERARRAAERNAVEVTAGEPARILLSTSKSPPPAETTLEPSPPASVAMVALPVVERNPFPGPRAWAVLGVAAAALAAIVLGLPWIRPDLPARPLAAAAQATGGTPAEPHGMPATYVIRD